MPPPATPRPPAGRRERHREAMRRHLYETAISLFAQKGYSATSFDDIAESADVARATVFNYFKRKDDFLRAWGDERRRRLDALLIRETTQEADLAEQLVRCMKLLGDLAERERGLTRELVLAWVRTGAPVLEEPYTAYVFAQIVTDGKAHGEIYEDVDPVTVGNLLRDVYLGTFYRWVGTGEKAPFSLSEALVETLEVIFQGILTRPRRPKTDDL